MSCVINIASWRPVQESPKQLPLHAGIILPFEMKADSAPHFSKGVQRKLFRRIRPNVAELLADPVPETLLLELSDLS